MLKYFINGSLWFFVAESLAEFELERKQRQHSTAERDQVKSPLQGSLIFSNYALNQH